MPRPKNPVPTYRLHRQSGQAVVTIPLPGGGRKDVLLGAYDSAASRAEYERVLAQLRTGTLVRRSDRTVNEVLVAFLKHADRHYRHPDGTPTTELAVYRLALRPLKALYGHVPADQFGPLALKAVRQRLIDNCNCRKVVNRHVGRIKRVFKWAVAEELVPPAVFQALAAVGGLQAGRTVARETTPVAPVDDATVTATLPFMTRHAAGVVRFMRLTGCRPAESCGLRRCDLDTSSAVWLYRPARHKTAHKGKPRVIPIGPVAQELLAEFPTTDQAEYVFCPARSRAEWDVARRAARKTKVQPSQACRKRPDAGRRPGAKYTAHAIAHAVRVAAERAGVEHWHPNRLRHAHATEVRKRYGLEAAQAVLGHAKADTTEIYAERDLTLAARVAAELG